MNAMPSSCECAVTGQMAVGGPLRGGRPPGEVRTVILEALGHGSPKSLRDLAHQCQVGLDAARRTLDHLVRAEVIEIVGYEKRAHCKKWVAMYDLVQPPEILQLGISPAAELNAAIAKWGR
jgi:hypothetical protein